MRHLLKILTMVMFITSCSNEATPPSVDHISLEMQVDRFDHDLVFASKDESLAPLKEKYPVFSELYFLNIIKSGPSGEDAQLYYLQSFLNDRYIRDVVSKVEEVYPSMEDVEGILSDAFKRYRLHFPNDVVPRLISFISGFSYTIVVDDSVLAFGLDMYLGEECEFYPRLGIPKYKFQHMHRGRIPYDSMLGWLTTEYEKSKDENDLLSEIIYQGKLLYAMDQLFPFAEDHVKIGYTADQEKWCRDNEANVWFHFVDRELLYSADNDDFTKYLKEGPFTPGFPEGSPGQIGKWIGWQIVRKYMENNPKVSLQQLLQQSLKAQAILTKSKYKPNR